MAVVISGKTVAEKLRAEIKSDTEKLKQKGVTPGLAVVLIGEDYGSKIYVRNKKTACEEVGFHSEQYDLPETATEQEVFALIDMLNEKPDIHGILIQSPFPKHIDPEKVNNRINPLKDVDVFHPMNVGKVMLGNYDFLPCTPAGVMELLKHENIEVEGKNCVVIGRSNIVGKPMFHLLLQKNGTVTVCHSKTKNIEEITKKADILVAAVGIAGFITVDMVKPGAVVIDVGMNRNAEGKVTGDVDYNAVEPIAGYITPVPGGVGPMTITMLLKNTYQSALKTI